MESSGRYVGGNLDEALSMACEGLRARIEEIQYDVVEEGGGAIEIEAKVDPIAVLGLFLSDAFRAGEFDLSVRLDQGSDALEGELSGTDFRILTGGKGRGLDALQYLCNRVLNHRLREHQPVHLDGEGFKDRRAERLQDEAEDAADEAVRRQRPVTLGPLTPAARREIHLALADDPGVETWSDGEGFLKRVVVRPRRGR